MTNKLRVIFAGTPDFALPTLSCLLTARFNVVAVVTQPDRPKGRGRKLTAPPVKQLAQSHDIHVLQPTTVTGDLVDEIRQLEPDVMVVVAFGLILPPHLLDVPQYGCINVHASLLPRWRGAAPIARAIAAGDRETGVTIMQMDAGLDTGPMLSQVKCPIESSDTADILAKRLAELGALELQNTLQALPESLSNAQLQDDRQATYAAKLSVAEAMLDWRQSAIELVRKIHACNPWPSARTQYENTKLKIWRAEVCSLTESSHEPGEVVESNRHGIVVGAGQDAVRILHLQRDGKRAMSAGDFIAGFQVPVGSKFGQLENMN